jgi:hypothetical protein
MEETVQEFSIFKKVASKFFRNGENTMTVLAGNEFTGHRKRTVKIIHVATGRAETAFAVKGNIFKVTTMRAAPEDTAIGRISAMNHLINIFNNGRSGMKFVDDMLIIIGKNLL